VYAVLAESGPEAEVRKLVELVGRLAGRNGGRVTAKVLQNSNSRRYRTADQAQADLERLAGLGLGRRGEGEATGRGGHNPLYFVPTPHPSDPEPRHRPTHDPSDPRPQDGRSDCTGDAAGPHDPPRVPTENGSAPGPVPADENNGAEHTCTETA